MAINKLEIATGQSSLGYVLVAQSAKGICAILLGDSEQELLDDLQQRFSGSDIKQQPALLPELHKIIAFIEQPSSPLKLRLDMQGTEFQQRVWQALCAIPLGETRSYKSLAEQLGNPGAVRALASACAANPIALAIPCHRVLRSDGGLSGYRWGVERKRELLKREAMQQANR